MFNRGPLTINGALPPKKTGKTRRIENRVAYVSPVFGRNCFKLRRLVLGSNWKRGVHCFERENLRMQLLSKTL